MNTGALPRDFLFYWSIPAPSQQTCRSAKWRNASTDLNCKEINLKKWRNHQQFIIVSERRSSHMFPTNKDFNSTTLTLRERVPRDHRANLLNRCFLQRSSSGLNLSRYFDGLEGARTRDNRLYWRAPKGYWRLLLQFCSELTHDSMNILWRQLFDQDCRWWISWA